VGVPEVLIHSIPFDTSSIHTVRMRLSSLTLPLLVTLASCATARRPGDSGYEYNVNGSYGGRFFIDDNPFDATLQLRTRGGGAVNGALRVTSPVQIDGSATGTVVDDLLRLTVTYRSPEGCDGRIEGILSITTGGGVIDGPITVTDCQGRYPGTMSFRRRDPRGSGDQASGARE